jgi:hypothetical protein
MNGFRGLIGGLLGKSKNQNGDALFKSTLQHEARTFLANECAKSTGQHAELFAFLKETGGTAALEALQSKLRSQVSSICDHADAVRHSAEGRIPEARNPDGSLRVEVQNWAMALAGLKLTRSLDIEAAFEVNAPFEQLIHDRDFLIALVKKNEGDDGFGKGIVLTEYIDKSAPEMAYTLLLQKQFDRFEAELWLFVCLKAGNAEAGARFSKVADVTLRSSIAHWRAFCSGRARDRAALQALLEQMADPAPKTFQQFANWDAQLRSLFSDSTDSEVRQKAYKLWDALGETWVQSLVKNGNEAAAKKLEDMRSELKNGHKTVTEATELIDRGQAAEALAMLQKLGKL